MALVGGGGAGNVAGSNPAGTGTTLNYIGNFVYGYSGPRATGGSGSADVTALDFSTGNETIICTVSQCDDGGGSADKLMTIKMDSQAIWQCRYTDNATNIGEQPIPIVIPPFTRVEVLVGSAASENMSVMLSGEIYA